MLCNLSESKAHYYNNRAVQINSNSGQGASLSTVSNKPLSRELASNAQLEKSGITEWSRSSQTPFVAQGFLSKSRPPPATADDESDQLSDASQGAASPPLDPDSYKHLRVLFDPTKFPPAPPSQIASGGANSAGRRAKTELAFSAPNLITGIPLIHLGSSAVYASNTLSPIGKINKHNINAWTVWIFNKNNSSEPAMQLYIRHGLVEAMRIFDSSLVSSDFGVKLGDRLVDVKQKFGEPAFMIAEPNSAHQPAQNYVYPISQVSFELSRVNKENLPKVVSILIFTVK